MLDFPASPVNGQTFGSWVWNGTTWDAIGGSGGGGGGGAPTIVTINGSGTTQGSAAALSANYAIAGTVTSSNNAFVLTLVPTVIEFVNPTTVDAQVFPIVGGQINALGLNTPTTVPAYGVNTFIQQTTTQWIAT